MWTMRLMLRRTELKPVLPPSLRLPPFTRPPLPLRLLKALVWVGVPGCEGPSVRLSHFQAGRRRTFWEQVMRGGWCAWK